MNIIARNRIITRKWPRGQKKDRFDEWIKDLSPEEDTLNQWEDSKRTEEDWKRYRVKLLPQMKKSEAANKIKELRHRSKNGEIITLLCYCESGEHCHTYIVKSLIEVRLQSLKVTKVKYPNLL